MVPIGGKPLLEHILDRLRTAGIEAAFIVTGYKAEMIEQHLAAYPMPITFRRQKTIDGTARATLLAREWVGQDSFLMTYADTLTEPENYRAMISMIENAPQAAAVVAGGWVDDPWQGAAVYVESGRVVRIIEKPPPGTSTTHWNSAGFYTFRADVFEEIVRVPKSPRGEYELTSALAQMIEAGRTLLLHAVEGGWRDVGRPEDLPVAERLIRQ